MKYIAENTVIDYKENYIRRNTEKIFETPFSDFDVCADDKGNEFIICQDKENGIYLITISGADVSSRCLLQSRITEGYEKFFNAEYVNGWINAIYSIKHEDKILLIHHIINSDIKPFVLDSLEEQTRVFMFKDYEDNLYAFYKNGQVGYKKYDWKSKVWSQFTAVCEAEGQLLFASGDFTKEPQFAFSVKKGKEILVYCMDKVLISGIREEVEPIVINYRRELTVLFEYQGRILKSVNVSGDSFTRPKYAYFGSVSRYELITSISDTYKTKTYASLTPRGTYRSLLMNEKTVKEVIKEPDPMPEETSVEKKYDEIIKLLENKSEYEILAGIMNKLTLIEKMLEDIKNGNTSE